MGVFVFADFMELCSNIKSTLNNLKLKDGGQGPAYRL